MRSKIVLALCALLLLGATPAVADDDDRRGRGHHWHGDHDDDRRWHHRGHGKHHKHYQHRGKHRWAKRHHRRGGWHKGRHWVPPGHRKVIIHRHHGHKRRPSYRHRRDDDWAVYAILALQIVDVMNQSQRNHYAWAQQRAYSAPIGETIRWHDGGAHGAVVPVREGSDTAGRYCREFQQQVVVGNRSQSGYGVACLQPDGAWQIVSN